MPLSFRIAHRDPATQARAALLQTIHGSVETPAFMPVGTAGTVKAMPHEFLEKLDAQIILANTYHLYLRPGHQLIRSLGGLHQFMAWQRPILTDSGGFQVFSHQALRKISEEGVEFQSHLDGSSHWFSPERSIEIQRALGADIIMAFDDCTPYPVTEAEARESMCRSMRWAERCQKEFKRAAEEWQSAQAGMSAADQSLFGIVQGSVFMELRRESLERIGALEFDGVALGGFSVGEPKRMMYDLVEGLAPMLPGEMPRYLMGVGTPLDLFFGVKQGIDMFDCVLPTRNARNGTVYTSQGKLSIKNARYRDDQGPLDANCGCAVCRRYSRAYLRHLYMSGEILSSVLNTYHNVYFYLELMRKIRENIALHSLAEFERSFRTGYDAPDEI